MSLSASIERFLAVYEREFTTVVRTRVYGIIALGFVLIILGLGLTRSVSGYVSVILNLLVPVEVLLPVLCAAFGYRALLADRESGELDMLRTYPLTRVTHISGVLLSRLTFVLLIVMLSFLFVGILIPVLKQGGSEFLLRRTSYNGPVLFVRFGVLTSVSSVVFLAIITAISAAAGRSQRMVAVAVFAVFGFALSFDLALVGGFATDVFAPRPPSWMLAVTPTSAYRGLVLRFVIEPASASSTRSGSAVANVVGLFVWFVGSFATAVYFDWK